LRGRHHGAPEGYADSDEQVHFNQHGGRTPTGPPAFTAAATPTRTPTPYPTATVGPPVEGGIYHYHYHYNHLGSVQVVTDANGAAVEYIRYKPYGEVRGHYDSSGTEEAVNTCADDHYCHEFTGYDTEPISGLQYAGARFYDPELGMFLTHDPAGQTANPYSYVAWDPVNQTDPTGAIFGIDDALFFAVVAVFAATAIDAGIKTGDVGAALKAGISSVPWTIAGSQVIPGMAGIVVAAAPTACQEIVAYALYSAAVGAGGYGTYQAAAHGDYATAGLGAVLTSLAIYQLATGNVTLGAQPAPPGGAPRVGTTPDQDISQQAPFDDQGGQVVLTGGQSKAGPENLYTPYDQPLGDPGPGQVEEVRVLRASAYDNCKLCTGKSPGDPGYGLARSGLRTGPGAIAADPNYFPPGTRMSIPGYGNGTVIDTGGRLITARRIDVWFPTHSAATTWGIRTEPVTILYPSGFQPRPLP
jgi:RHS repeat-associated protein